MRTGRPPEEGVTRDTPVCFKVGDQDVQILDANRGSMKRSAYLRHLIRTSEPIEDDDE